MSSRRPQRRHLDREHAEPVEQIEPEPAVGDLLLQIAIGRRQHADVHPPGRVVADALELAFLQDAQQLRLEIQRDLADLVEKQRAAVRPAGTARSGRARRR